MRVWNLVCALLAWLTLAPAVAAAADPEYATSPDGAWFVGRGEATSPSCSAGLEAKGGGLFLLLTQNGEVSFSASGGKSRPPRGKAGVLATDKARFDFTPSYDKTAVFLDGALDPKVVAALREAQDLAVAVDGKTVFEAHVAGTGIAGAIDGMLACAKGEAGWWGKGAGQAAAPLAPVLNKEGAWALVATDKPGICIITGKVDDHVSVQFLGAAGDVGFALNSDGKLPRGRQGELQVDGVSAAFKPEFDGPDYLYAADVLDAATVAALGPAKALRVRLDGREVVSANLEGSGLAGALTALQDCSVGRSGWWGKGAPQK